MRVPERKLILANGMTLYANHRPFGMTAVYFCVNGGSFCAVPPEVPHITEHLLGDAAGVYGKQCLLRYCAERGAQTGPQNTLYYFEGIRPEHTLIAVQCLKKVFDKPPIELLEHERKILLEEHPKKTTPSEQFAQRLLKHLFPNFQARITSPRKSLQAVRKITEQTVIDYWCQYYNPANTIVYLSGEITPYYTAVIDGLENIAAQGLPVQPVSIENEPPLLQRQQICEALREDGKIGLIAGYQAPYAPHSGTLREQLAAEFLSEHLDSDTGPLYCMLRDKKELCYSLGIKYTTGMIKNAGLFINAETSKLRNVQHIERAWNKAISRIANKSITSAELTALKNKILILECYRALTFDVESIFMEIERNICYEELLKTTETLTLDDIAAAAQRFSQQNYVIGIALPKK
ncbi:insulinase family protein [Candidatus Woesearchaeota archaeon]|nr:insulinase family protein [Candidatus Woesearchaeota archaeon]